MGDLRGIRGWARPLSAHFSEDGDVKQGRRGWMGRSSPAETGVVRLGHVWPEPQRFRRFTRPYAPYSVSKSGVGVDAGRTTRGRRGGVWGPHMPEIIANQGKKIKTPALEQWRFCSSLPVADVRRPPPAPPRCQADTKPYMARNRKELAEGPCIEGSGPTQFQAGSAMLGLTSRAGMQ